VRAQEIFRQKLYLVHQDGVRLAIYEVAIWKIPVSMEFPNGIKYRVWLSESGRTIFGIDNHRPKGHHLHLGNVEMPYLYRDVDELKTDAANLIRQEGFIYED